MFGRVFYIGAKQDNENKKTATAMRYMDFITDDRDGSVSFKVLLDTGSSSDIATRSFVEREGLTIVHDGDQVKGMSFVGFNGAKSQSKGRVTVNLITDDGVAEISFYVVDFNNTGYDCIIGLSSLDALQIGYWPGLAFRWSSGKPVGRSTELQLDRDQICAVNPGETCLVSPKHFGQDETEVTKEVNIEQLIENRVRDYATPELTNRELARLTTILKNHSRVWAKNSTDIGQLPDGFEFKQTFCSGPPSSRQYQISKEKQLIVESEIKKMLAMGVLEEAEVDIVTSTFLVVKKSDNTYRSVVDLRATNSITIASNRTLPRLDDIMQKLSGQRYFVSIDISKAFWNLRVSEDQKMYYTTQSPLTRKTYVYRRLPMGATNASVEFQCALERVIGQVDDIEVTVYIDDLNLASKSKEALLTGLDIILERLEKANLRASLAKCRFMTDHVLCFGYLIDKSGIKPDPSRVKKILD